MLTKTTVYSVQRDMPDSTFKPILFTTHKVAQEIASYFTVKFCVNFSVHTIEAVKEDTDKGSIIYLKSDNTKVFQTKENYMTYYLLQTAMSKLSTEERTCLKANKDLVSQILDGLGPNPLDR